MTWKHPVVPFMCTHRPLEKTRTMTGRLRCEHAALTPHSRRRPSQVCHFTLTTESSPTDSLHISFKRPDPGGLHGPSHREPDSGSTCLCGGLRIHLTLLTSGDFLVYVTLLAAPFGPAAIGCPGPLLFPTHSLITRGLTVFESRLFY